jgi:hypothetical protein
MEINCSCLDNTRPYQHIDMENGEKLITIS